jgi:hypothetical protein
MTWRMRPGRLAIGLAVLASGYLLLHRLDAGTFQGRPHWFGYLWIATMLLSLLAAPILIGNGLGLFSSELLAESGTGRAPTARQWVTVYLGTLVTIVSLSLGLNWIAGVHPVRSLPLLTSAMFLFACVGRPWWLFATVRRTGWFALIADDRSVRIVLGSIAFVLLAVGLAGPVLR